jgi:hypothetical protein
LFLVVYKEFVMATKATWTEDDETLGTSIRYNTVKFAGNWPIKCAKAAAELGHKEYLTSEKYAGVRSYLAHVGGSASRERAVTIDTHGPSVPVVPGIGLPVKTRAMSSMEAAWWREIISNPQIRQARLHPEDDRAILDYFANEALAAKR